MSQNDKETAHDHDSDREKIRIDAAEWFAKVIDGGLKPAEQAKLDAWLAHDPRHAEAYVNIERLWRGSGELPELRDQPAGGRKLSRRDIGKAVLVLVAGAVVWRFASDHPLADYRTGVGERRSFEAPDGSRIELAPETRLSLFYDEAIRKIILHEGEAFFRVAPEPRSFTVMAGTGEATALGTAFSVRYRDGTTQVVVAEHTVRVTAGRHQALVNSGFELHYAERIGPVESVNVDEVLAWREGRLVFNGKPLGEVVAALNLWRRGRIVVVGQSLAQRPVTLLIDTDRVASIGEQLERVLPVRLIQITPFLILLFPA